MTVIRSIVRGIGAATPKRLVKNADLAGIVETSDEWIVERFNQSYPKEISDSEVISDLLSCHYLNHSLRLSECDACGRLWIQQGPEENAYRSFAPDEGGYGRHLLITGSMGCSREIATNNANRDSILDCSGAPATRPSTSKGRQILFE